MNRDSILSIFRSFYRSGVWAARRLKVPKSTVSEWLHGRREHTRLAAEMPKLAAELVRTAGKCMATKSVRSQLKKLRPGDKRVMK